MDVSPHVWTFRPTMDISPHGDSPIEVSPYGRGAKRLRANRHGAKCPYMRRNVHGANCQWGETPKSPDTYIVLRQYTILST